MKLTTQILLVAADMKYKNGQPEKNTAGAQKYVAAFEQEMELKIGSQIHKAKTTEIISSQIDLSAYVGKKITVEIVVFALPNKRNPEYPTVFYQIKSVL